MLICAGGCQGPRRGEYLSSLPLAVASSGEQADAVWGAIQETLRRHHLRLDRVDRRAGVITTVPVISQHFFEFWRHDVDTRADAWESSLNPIRRWVEVSVRPTGEGRWAQLAVVVHKERLSSPDRQFNSTGAAYQYFGNSLPTTTGEKKVAAGDDQWIDIGRDAAMEDHFVRAMLERAGVGSEVEAAPSS